MVSIGFISTTTLHESWFSKFIQVGSHNLKRLDFVIRPETPVDIAFLDRFLIELKHLQEFRLLVFSHNHDEAEFASLFLVHFDGVDETIPENWSLKTIELDTHGSALYMPLDTFVTKLRGLEYVKFKSADFRDPMVVGQALAQCPNLRAVAVTEKYSSGPDLHKLKKKGEGLHYLELNDEFCEPGVYIPLITKHHKTIETLKLNGLILTEGAVRSFIQLDLPSLKKLVIKDKTLFMGNTLDNGDDRFTSDEDFDTLIHSFSRLEYLELSVFHYITDDMLESLESMTCLKNLEMVVCDVSEESLLQFLNRSQSRHCLKELKLAGQQSVTNEVLHAIGRDLSALTHLSLTEKNHISLFYGLECFLDTSPIIEKLWYLNIDCFEEDDDLVPTDEEVDNVLHKLQARVNCWHFCLDIPSKKRRRVRGVDWWFEHYSNKGKRSAEPVQDDDDDEDDEEEDSSDDD
ncbi:hypothetical protein K492DRAFT_62639 [Lichtheimia hyalospora FSU 10163]|nr:hypothetical protein K492DRAFT_62639 [Lichtheimia hyalospora FSU 10163]